MLRYLAVLCCLIGSAQAQTSGNLLAALQSSPDVLSQCPTITGAKMGNVSDRATWSADFALNPSGACLTVVAGIIAGLAAPITSVAVTSTLFPALNGTYPIDSGSLQNIQFLASYVAINGSFPAGQSSQIWLDSSQQRHTFTTTAEWQAFAKAMADAYALVNLGGTPANPVTIP